MKNKMWFSCCLGILVCFCLSVLFHFIFDKTGWLWTSVFSPVNESVWEHTKILFYPFLFYSIIEAFVIKPYLPQYIAAKSISLAIMPFLMIGLYYAYTSITGKSILFVDIMIALICFIVAFCLSHKLYNSNLPLDKIVVPSVLLVVLIIALLTVFTYKTPTCDLFKDPVTGTYGMMGYLLKQVNDFIVIFGN